MSRYLLPAIMLLLPANALAQQPAAESPPDRPGYLKWLAKGSFTTLLESQGTYQVRVMTAEQKAKAETAAAEYVKQRAAYVEYTNAVRRRDRGPFAPADGAPAPELPAKVDPPARIAADLAGGEFFEIADLGEDYVELKSGDTHVILPVASIRVILLGEKGGLGTPSRSTTIFDRSTFPGRTTEDVPRGVRGE